MILSAGLTPAWQQILVFDSFRYGEVNRAAEVHWCASGKVFNAGIGVHHLLMPAQSVREGDQREPVFSRPPAGRRRSSTTHTSIEAESLTLATAGGPPLVQIRAEMESLGVPLEIVETQSATRVCTTILDRSTGTMTELVENGRPVTDAELDAFEARLAANVQDADALILIGTLPQGTPSSFYRRLIHHASCPTILDFRGEGLLAVLDLQPTIIKPNREELARTVGHELSTDEALVGSMRSLNARGAQWVLITDGPRPVWLTSRSETYRFHPPRVPPSEVVNPIGCGDAMAAALAWAICEGAPIPEAVRLGIAASVDNLRQLLPCRLSRERVRTIADTVRAEVL